MIIQGNIFRQVIYIFFINQQIKLNKQFLFFFFNSSFLMFDSVCACTLKGFPVGCVWLVLTDKRLHDWFLAGTFYDTFGFIKCEYVFKTKQKRQYSFLKYTVQINRLHETQFDWSLHGNGSSFRKMIWKRRKCCTYAFNCTLFQISFKTLK